MTALPGARLVPMEMGALGGGSGCWPGLAALGGKGAFLGAGAPWESGTSSRTRKEIPPGCAVWKRVTSLLLLAPASWRSPGALGDILLRGRRGLAEEWAAGAG